MEVPSSEEYGLAFANTLAWHASAQPVETIHSYADLVRWAERIGVITADHARLLTKTAEREPVAAAAVLRRALALREAIYRVFVVHIHEQSLDANDLVSINQELALALPHRQLITTATGFVWEWEGDGKQLDALLWPLARAAAELLTSTELLPRVGQCADDRGCGWLFLDLSKNHSRRWCDINDCGNRAKQRRHYARARGKE